ncbi:MAG: hypothetical protein ABIT38_12135, partial [Gemmatimonadaceae bacterium]
MRSILTISGVLAITALSASLSAAQGSASRLAQVRNGQVRFTFNLRPGVCGRGSNIWTTGRGKHYGDNDRSSRDVDYD